MDLHKMEAGDGPLLVILHGLLGSSRNWNGVVRTLGEFRRAVALDLPNHGASPWTDGMSYAAMAGEVAAAIEALGGRAAVLGHSMGGKVAMTLALTRPDLVERLIVVDIAPVRYSHGFRDYIRAMRAVPMDLGRRAEVDSALAAAIPDARVRGFLLQNLDGGPGAWRWKPNLAALDDAMADILGFPAFPPSVRYDGPGLFIAGAESDYVPPAYEPAVHQLFPRAQIHRIAAAGHWVHADRPDEFIADVTRFLTA